MTVDSLPNTFSTTWAEIRRDNKFDCRNRCRENNKAGFTLRYQTSENKQSTESEVYPWNRTIFLKPWIPYHPSPLPCMRQWWSADWTLWNKSVWTQWAQDSPQSVVDDFVWGNRARRRYKSKESWPRTGFSQELVWRHDFKMINSLWPRSRRQQPFAACDGTERSFLHLQRL